MSRQERCQEYAKAKGPHGASRDQKNLDRWADRATQNSEPAPRASSRMDLASTGKMELRDSEKAPFQPRKINAKMKADNMDIADDEFDTSYLPSIRRNA